ncbi:chitin-binding protein [Curtobacterium sp. SGAir0471]|uniref:lytic polysaccharide monooxygenase n=1 Tax=Curtobacterium sp. SGAir0471 TaxID=2070337 RepID=UPI0010CD053B|nr:lytic polysaccharide monooxygenase [Curtobacterium sp. SGAir0471]QCR42970.1 chitin-binding protein [Curtobacterium sp. SGAir0471]
MRIVRPALATCIAAAAVGAAALVPSTAFAHGYVGTTDPSGTALTARAALAANTGLGGIQYEPQSLEAPKGFPAAGPADGHLASAGQSVATALDEQREDRWVKNEVEAGPVTVDWTFTAPHPTSQWRYYMTKVGWDPNDELDRGDFELIGTVEHDGSVASNNPSHEITIPADREGYHVIYAVWDVADTANAFYNVIDVDVQPGDDGDTGGPGGEDTTPPSPARDVRGTAVSPTEVRLDWGAASDDVGVDHYRIWDAAERAYVATLPATARTATLGDLTPDTRHTFGVVPFDAAGNHSSYEIVVVRTPAPDEQTLSAPTHLHSMGTTSSSVDLMWMAGDDTEGVRYEVLRDGELVGTTSDRTFTDRGLRAASEYRYEVRAVSGDRRSDLSNVLTVTTDTETAPEPGLPTWDAFAQYVQGDRVVHDGTVYEAVQTHQGYGDPAWITALSLWKPVA